MKIKKSSFITSAVKKEQYPPEDLPEIAFVGRSNVGKSSIINMLLGRKGLAKTSSTPGKTQLVNFFDIDGLIRYVDLPGYGFAKVSKQQKEGWSKIIDTYLMNRPNLLEVVLLVDLRHSPTADDVQMYEWIRHAGYGGVVVATKSDKLTQSQILKNLKEIRSKLKLENEIILIPTSSENRKGKYDVWDYFNGLFQINELDVLFERQSD